MVASDHPSFGRPRDPAITIWRYMDSPKFDWLLRELALYFRRADGFADPLEGHYNDGRSGV